MASMGSGLVGLAPEVVHKVALSGWLTFSEVAALSQTCKRMASILVWDEYGRDIHYALKGVMENVKAERWRSAQFAVRRRWFVGEEEEGETLWRKVVEAVVGREMDDLAGWEGVVVAALSLPGVRGWEKEWTFMYMEIEDDDDDMMLTTSLLHVAAELGSVRVVDYVVERGGDLDRVNDLGDTPLLVACEMGYLGVVKRLVEGGANVEVTGERGKNVVHAACSSGNVELVRYVLGLGVFAGDVEDSEGQTPLIYACQYECLDVAKVLVEEVGVAVDVEGKNSRGPLFWACGGEDIGLVRFLVNAGVGSGAGKDEGVWVEAMVMAASGGYVDTVRELMRLGVGVDGVDEHGETALGAASRGGRVDVVRVLLGEGGADVNKIVEGGRTALVCACTSGHCEVVRVLLEAGADVGIVDGVNGMGPLELARMVGLGGVVALLEEWGA